jgi:plastocyanin
MRKAGILIAAMVASVVACGGGGDGGGEITGTQNFTSLSVKPATSVNVLVGGTQALAVTALDQSNKTMSGLTTTYNSGTPSVATVDANGVITGVAVGSSQVTVTGTIGSVSKTATVNVTVSVPGPTASVAAMTNDTFSPATAFITQNGTVTWTFATTHNVTFDGSGGPANIPDTSTGSASRTFPTKGTFAYHCTIHPGMSGSVVVQ